MRSYRARLTIELDVRAPNKRKAREWVLENVPHYSRRQPEYGFVELELESDPDSATVEMLPMATKEEGKK